MTAYAISPPRRISSIAGRCNRVAAAPHRRWSTGAAPCRSAPPPTSPATGPDGRPEPPAPRSRRAARSAPHTRRGSGDPPATAAHRSASRHARPRAPPSHPSAGRRCTARSRHTAAARVRPLATMCSAGSVVVSGCGAGWPRAAARSARRCHTGRTLASSHTNGAQEPPRGSGSPSRPSGRDAAPAAASELAKKPWLPVLR